MNITEKSLRSHLVFSISILSIIILTINNNNLLTPRNPCSISKQQKIFNFFKYLEVLQVDNDVLFSFCQLCVLIGGQATMKKLDEQQTANMVKAAATNVDDRKRKIREAVSLLSLW